MKIIIKSPKLKEEYEDYFHFRWEKLRKEFNKAKGTERDNLENRSFHIMLMDRKKIIGVGRIHFILDKDIKNAQVRFMAIDSKYQRKGYGTLMLQELEKYAYQNEVKNFFLHARENAIKFYENNGYSIIKKSHLLFGQVQHWLMKKTNA